MWRRFRPSLRDAFLAAKWRYPGETVSRTIQLTLISFSLLGGINLFAAPADEPFLQAVEGIQAADLESDLYFLASDEMQGRGTNTPFNQIVSRYLAHRFELKGLEPAGNDGSYFQFFSVAHARLSSPNRFEIRVQGSPATTTALLKENFFPCLLSGNGKVTAPVVFAGYGISAPQHRYDDYQGIDVRGKVVLVMNHEPGERDPESVFDGLVNSDYARQLHKILNAQAHGAAGVIIIQDQANHPGPERFAKDAERTWPENASRVRYTLQIWVDQVAIPAVYASRKIATTLMQRAEKTLDEIQESIDRDRRPHGFPLAGVRATLETSILREETRLRNVLALLPGSDPVLRNEVVILGAHFDHIGVRDGEIYNGADDDASGTAGLFEIAEAFSLNSTRPKRSVLFAGWNAEEQGLLGSYYYVAHPSFPLEKTAAMFQMDMIGRNEEIPDSTNPRFRGLRVQSAQENTNAVNVLGYSHSGSLRRLVTKSNEKIGLELKFRYDNHEANLLRRSDHWPFLNVGVPVLFFHTGLHPDYHGPGDTPEKINYVKMERIVRLVFLCSWIAAN